MIEFFKLILKLDHAGDFTVRRDRNSTTESYLQLP